MSLFNDLRTIYNASFRSIRGEEHADRMAALYGPQAETYDDFRRRSLPGRGQLCELVELFPGATWIDFGGGTAANLEFVAKKIPELNRVYIVDVCGPLLEMARRRCKEHGWTNVECVEADAGSFQPDSAVDVVTFSYSLSMMPNWLTTLKHAHDLLKPGGRIGVVDFYIARKFPADGLQRHGWFTRTFWPLWFAHHHVNISADHLPALRNYFHQQHLREDRIRLPYMLVRAQFYLLMSAR